MVSVALGRLKKRLQRYYQKAYPDSGEIIHRMIDEQEAKAREISFFPHLILSDLVDELSGNSACSQPKRAMTRPAFRTISLKRILEPIMNCSHNVDIVWNIGVHAPVETA